VRLLGKWGH
jgi:hypothetical protein